MNPAKAAAIYFDEFRKVYKEKGGASMEEDVRRQAREEAREAWDSLFGDPLERWRDREKGFHKSRRPTRAEISREVEKCYESGDPWNALPIGTFNRTYDD